MHSDPVFHRVHLWAILAAATCLALPGQTPAAVPPLPVAVAGDDPILHYSGRFKIDGDPEGPACQWPASAVTLRFTGTDVNARLADSSGQDRWQIVLDGKPTGKLALQKGAHNYPVASGLASGEHTVELIKCTESFFGVTRVGGFELNAGGRALPAVAARHRIEIIGDSISCGYGDEAATKEDHLSPANENAWLAYGAVAARLLEADYTCVAWSGKKLWPDNTIGELYNRTLPTALAEDWDFKKTPAPGAVVITLGTNDLGQVMPDEAGWSAAYKAFIARIRGNYPGVPVFCASSPMVGDNGPLPRRTILHDWLTKIVADENAVGDTKVYYVDFALQDPKNGIGADWHPSTKTHEIMGMQLAAAIKKNLGW